MIRGPLSQSGYNYVTVDLKAETDKWKFSCGRCGRRTNRSCTLNLARRWCSFLYVPSSQPCNHNNFLASNPPTFYSSYPTWKHTCTLDLFVTQGLFVAYMSFVKPRILHRRTKATTRSDLSLSGCLQTVNQRGEAQMSWNAARRPCCPSTLMIS